MSCTAPALRSSDQGVLPSVSRLPQSRKVLCHLQQDNLSGQGSFTLCCKGVLPTTSALPAVPLVRNSSMPLPHPRVILRGGFGALLPHLLPSLDILANTGLPGIHLKGRKLKT